MFLQCDPQSLVIWKLVHAGPHSRPAESETAQRPKFSQNLHMCFWCKLQSSNLEYCFDSVVQRLTYLQCWKMCKENLWHGLNIAAKLIENLLYIFYSSPPESFPSFSATPEFDLAQSSSAEWFRNILVIIEDLHAFFSVSRRAKERNSNRYTIHRQLSLSGNNLETSFRFLLLFVCLFDFQEISRWHLEDW